MMELEGNTVGTHRLVASSVARSSGRPESSFVLVSEVGAGWWNRALTSWGLC